ncbi:MAG: glycoside hydrolase family 30 beta sandwich domain-containing protein [Anaerolineales bacterium]
MKTWISKRRLLLFIVLVSACSGPTPAVNLPTPTQTERVIPTSTPHAQTPTTLPAHSTVDLATATPVGLPSSAKILVNIDASITHQTMDGFGATHLPLVYESMGDVLTPKLRSEAIDAVYRQVRLNLGGLDGALLESPGNYEQRANDNDDPLTINWNGFQTFSADAIYSNVVVQAAPLGFTDYSLSQKINIRWASPWLENIRSTNYPLYLEEAAEQVVAQAEYWRDQHGSLPPYIVLFNEPLSGNGELLSGDTKEVIDLIKTAGSRLEQEGFADVKFIVTNEETPAKSLEVATAILNDAEARKYVGVIGYHAYPYDSIYSSVPNILNTSGVGVPDAEAVAVRKQLQLLSEEYGVPMWMTEVSHGDVDPLSYEDFRGRAIHIHDELVYANASAYFGMNNMWDTTSQQLHFGDKNLFDYSNEGNIVLIDNDEQKMYITGMGYAIGHYARWIKPGSVRVEAVSEDPLVQITAFISPDSSQLILVLINNNMFPREINLNLKSAELAGDVSGEQSTPDQYWSPVAGVEASSDGFAVTLPAESVTTYMFPLVP